MCSCKFEGCNQSTATISLQLMTDYCQCLTTCCNFSWPIYCSWCYKYWWFSFLSSVSHIFTHNQHAGTIIINNVFKFLTQSIYLQKSFWAAATLWWLFLLTLGWGREVFNNSLPKISPRTLKNGLQTLQNCWNFS